jgi:hypothetical protein
VSRDDRILAVTRISAILITAVLVVAWAILYLFPSETGELFAWTIRPDETALFMGAAYLAGGYWFFSLARGERWHEFAAYFPGITLFTAMLGIATIISWEVFHHDQLTFLVWVFLYATTPFLVPALYLANRRTDPGIPEPDDLEVPAAVRLAAGAVGAGMLGFALVIFADPDLAIDIWPWQLSELTARVISAFIAAPGLGLLVVSAERRWSGWRPLVLHVVAGTTLPLTAAALGWEDFDDDAGRWLYVAGLAVLMVAAIGLYASLERRRAQASARG